MIGLSQAALVVGDLRVHDVRLTPQGTDLVRRGDVAFEREKAVAMADVEAEDMRAAIRALGAMNAALDPAADK